MYWPYINDDDGNTYRETLGPYRGNQPAFHNSHPVIFDQESTPPMKRIGILSGALTPEKGIVGTLGSESHHHGKTRLIIYGDSKTGEPSSWTLLEWVPSGKKQPNTNIELYEWRRAPNAKAALAKDGFHESYSKFERAGRSAINTGKK
jgi:hypothetical protein